MPFPQVHHNVVDVQSPSVPFDPPPEARLWIGRAIPTKDKTYPLGALWVYHVNCPEVSRYWLLLTVGEPRRLRIQFNGHPEQAAIVKANGDIAARLPGWTQERDERGVPADRRAFMTHAPDIEIDGAAEVTIDTISTEHKIRITWTDASPSPSGTAAQDALTVRKPPGPTVTKGAIAELTGWSFNQVDFFIVDIAATRTAEWWLTAEELNRIHELVAQRPPLKDRRSVGLGRQWQMRTEMIRSLNERLAKRGRPLIEKGAAVRGLQWWASQEFGTIDATAGIDPALYTATVDVVHSGDYQPEPRPTTA